MDKAHSLTCAIRNGMEHECSCGGKTYTGKTEHRQEWEKRHRIVSNGETFRVEKKGFWGWEIMPKWAGAPIRFSIGAEFHSIGKALDFVEERYKVDTYKPKPFIQVWP